MIDHGKSIPVSTRLRQPMVDLIEKLAAAERRNRSQLVAILLEDALAARGLIGRTGANGKTVRPR